MSGSASLRSVDAGCVRLIRQAGNTSAEPQFHRFGRAVTRTGYSTGPDAEYPPAPQRNMLADLFSHACHRQKSSIQQENVP